MFLPVKSDTGADTPWEYLPAAAGTYQVGQLLTVTGGKLAAISAASATTPPYVCMKEGTVKDGENLPVIRVGDDEIYETTLAAAATDAVVGGKIKVAAGGLQATTGAGAFEITYAEGTAKGDLVRGRFAPAAAAASASGGNG